MEIILRTGDYLAKSQKWDICVVYRIYWAGVEQYFRNGENAMVSFPTDTNFSVLIRNKMCNFTDEKKMSATCCPTLKWFKENRKERGPNKE